MIVVREVVPGGPADGRLEVGDVIVRVGGAAGERVPSDRGGARRRGRSGLVGRGRGGRSANGRAGVFEVERRAWRMPSRSPSRTCMRSRPTSYLEYAGGVLNPLSYHQARNASVAVGGVYVASAGYALARAGVPRRAVITELAGEPTPDLARFEEVLRLGAPRCAPARALLPALSQPSADGGRAAQRSALVLDAAMPTRRRDGPLALRGVAGAAAAVAERRERRDRLRRRGALGRPARGSVARDGEDLDPLPSRRRPRRAVPRHRPDRRYRARSRRRRSGDGADRARATSRSPSTARSRCPASSSICIRSTTSPSSATTRRLIGETPVRAARIRDVDLDVGDEVWMVGLTSTERVVSRRTRIARREPMQMPLTHPPRFRETNLEVATLEDAAQTVGGVLTDRFGRVLAFWASFSSGSGCRDRGLLRRHPGVAPRSAWSSRCGGASPVGWHYARSRARAVDAGRCPRSRPLRSAGPAHREEPIPIGRRVLSVVRRSRRNAGRGALPGRGPDPLARRRAGDARCAICAASSRRGKVGRRDPARRGRADDRGRAAADVGEGTTRASCGRGRCCRRRIRC